VFIFSSVSVSLAIILIIEDRHRRVRTSRLLSSGRNDELWDGTVCQAGYYFWDNQATWHYALNDYQGKPPPDAPRHARWRSIGRRIVAMGGIKGWSASDAVV
jgi:hypothetical protein